MSIDYDLVKKRLADLQQTTTKNTNLWKPEPGENVVRIVPYQHNKENPFLELYFYYNLGRKNYVSLVTFNEQDPIVEFSEQLMATGNREDWILGKKLQPKLRTYVPVIVRGKEKEGVKFWGFGKEIYQELLRFIADPDYGDITDLSNGRDVVVEYQTPKEAKNNYGKISIRVKPNQTRVTDNKEVADQIMNSQPDIYEVFQKNTYDELKNALANWLNPEQEEENETNEMIQQARAKGGVATEPKDESDEDEFLKEMNEPVTEAEDTPKVTDKDDIEESFEDLFK